MALNRRDYRGVRRFRRVLTLAVLSAGFLLLPSSAHAIKIVTYNLLNYTAGSARDADFKVIFSALQADVVVVQEMGGNEAAGFLSSVLNASGGPGGYSMATYHNGPDTDCALYYRSAVITYGGAGDHVFLSSSPRGVDRWRLGLDGYSSDASKFYVYSMHLKASQGYEAERHVTASMVRNDANQFPAGTHFIYAGDFNVYTSTEDAYQDFVGSQADNDGRAFDPINMSGAWHNSYTYRYVHTQATTSAMGGMDDRFDFLLISASLNDGDGFTYIPGTYDPYGNDGNHFNEAITDPPTIPEGAAMATALHDASDHLPVVLEVKASSLLEWIPPINFGYAIVSANVERTITVENTAPSPAQDLEYSFVYPAAYSGDTGPFSDPAGGGGSDHIITFSSLTSGNLSDTLQVCNNSPDGATSGDCPGEWSRYVALQGWMLDHAIPSTNSPGQVLTADLDFGMHVVGDFDDQTATVYNDGYNSYQSLLEVYDSQISGDSEFSVLGFQPPDPAVGDTPASFTVQFDDAGIAAGVYSATLTFSTRDDMSLPGAIDLDALVFNLSATLVVKGDMDMSNVVDSVDIAAFIAVLQDPAGKTDLERFIADMDGDGFNNGDDIQLFVNALLGLP